MPHTPLEATDLLRFADLFSERLAAASIELDRKRGLQREKGWLAAAAELVDAARAPAKGLLDRARMLPELAELREELAGSVQSAWVDALEKLLAGITFHVSSRSPIIEALFPHQKLVPLRRAPFEVAAKFQADFEKRARTGYVHRMITTDDFAFATPVLEQLRAAFADYQACFSDASMPEEDAAPIRQALVTAAENLETPLRQARLLAEAALLPVEGAFEQAGLGAKPRKRNPRPAAAAAPAPEPELRAEVEAAPAPEAAPPKKKRGPKAGATAQTPPGDA
jgi:hypothetical protein